MPYLRVTRVKPRDLHVLHLEPQRPDNRIPQILQWENQIQESINGVQIQGREIGKSRGLLTEIAHPGGALEEITASEEAPAVRSTRNAGSNREQYAMDAQRRKLKRCFLIEMGDD